MVFSSLTFLFLFLPVTLLLYYIVPKKIKNLVLLVMSLIFYAWGEPVYVILMLYSILLNYAAGRLMEAEPNHKKAVLVFTVILNLLILGFFKYFKGPSDDGGKKVYKIALSMELKPMTFLIRLRLRKSIVNPMPKTMTAVASK